MTWLDGFALLFMVAGAFVTAYYAQSLRAECNDETTEKREG